MVGQRASIDATQTTSIFQVQDLERAREHYRALGFTVLWQSSTNTECVVERGNLILHLTCGREGDLLSGAAYLTVDDAVAVALEWSRPEIGGTTTLPMRTLHGRREGVHCDLDGNLIRFGSSIFKTMVQAS
jgi:hypothetical protein